MKKYTEAEFLMFAYKVKQVGYYVQWPEELIKEFKEKNYPVRRLLNFIGASRLNN